MADRHQPMFPGYARGHGMGIPGAVHIPVLTGTADVLALIVGDFLVSQHSDG